MNHRVRIKICGMTRREDIDQAISLGVDAFGLIFHEKSPRYIPFETAERLLDKLHPFVTAVAVLVDPAPDFVYKLLNRFPFLLLQFHGNETPAFCETFGVPYIKAVSVESANTILEAEKNYGSAAALLLDSKQGGSGVTFDWKNIPGHRQKPWILAGGLHAGNVQKALQMVNPWAVDVCSGVESMPGIKDAEKMRAFMNVSSRQCLNR